jgi:hypothetical protein
MGSVASKMKTLVVTDYAYMSPIGSTGLTNFSKDSNMPY